MSAGVAERACVSGLSSSIASVKRTMAFFGFRAYPTPILKPLWPFFASSAIVYYCVSKMQYAGVRSSEYAKDPKNPYRTLMMPLALGNHD